MVALGARGYVVSTRGEGGVAHQRQPMGGAINAASSSRVMVVSRLLSQTCWGKLGARPPTQPPAGGGTPWGVAGTPAGGGGREKAHQTKSPQRQFFPFGHFLIYYGPGSIFQRGLRKKTPQQPHFPNGRNGVFQKKFGHFAPESLSFTPLCGASLSQYPLPQVGSHLK